MASATLQFTFPDDHREHILAVHGAEFYSLIWEIDEFARSKLKYAEPTEDGIKILEEIRGLLRERLQGIICGEGL